MGLQFQSYAILVNISCSEAPVGKSRLNFGYI